MNVDPEELKPSLNIIKTLNSPSNVWSYMKFKKIILFLILQLNHRDFITLFLAQIYLPVSVLTQSLTSLTDEIINFQTPGSKTWHEAWALHRNIGGLLSWKRHYLHPKENTKYFRRDCCWIKLDPDPHVLLLVVAKLFVFFFLLASPYCRLKMRAIYFLTENNESVYIFILGTGFSWALCHRNSFQKTNLFSHELVLS